VKPGKTPFIGSIDDNNEVSGFAGQRQFRRAAQSPHQPDDFRACDDVNFLYPKFPLTPAIAMFLVTLIQQERYRFTCGRKRHLDRMKVSEIRLPVCGDGLPDWKPVECYVNSLPFSSQPVQHF
jgi:hypothetical protein